MCPDLTGIGGGFLMTIYNRTTNTSLFINARETAPGATNYTMYDSDPTKSLTGMEIHDKAIDTVFELSKKKITKYS